ncbi:MAG: PilZ domain-containing protein [Sphingomonadaceae bacterium]|nr:PilZ domain-containing protein [Sphingomonadaceae bacterium]
MASAPLPFDGPDPDMPATLGRRSAERFKVLVPARLVLLAGEFECALEDISTSGARIITDVPLRTGNQGILRCSPLDVLFLVCWTEGKSAGLQFDEEASLGTIRQLRWNNDCYRGHHDEELRRMLQGWMKRGEAAAIMQQPMRSV